jgi:predicted 2-oxoglutarate/Fe(II)-dependent dioxygenase YbiX
VLNTKDFIQIWEGIAPRGLCDLIVSEYGESNELSAAVVSKDNIVKPEIRSCTSVNLSNQNTIQKNPELRRRIDEGVFEVMRKALSLYVDKFKYIDVERDTGYQFLSYKEGQHYSQHADSSPTRPRILSCSIALNDGYEGGEFAFFDRSEVYNLKQGSVLMFPSNFMYPHEVMPVTKGTRYAIVSWFV